MRRAAPERISPHSALAARTASASFHAENAAKGAQHAAFRALPPLGAQSQPFAAPSSRRAALHLTLTATVHRKLAGVIMVSGTDDRLGHAPSGIGIFRGVSKD
jgi:hypothetical protein